jgi:hypothetical protein
MPTLDAYVYDALGRVLVETYWGDVSWAESVQVRRVHADGTRWPLRTYVWPDLAAGEYQHLSGGWAAFWDTEAPLDQPFTYEADAVDALGALVVNGSAQLVAYDSFNRPAVASGWGTATSGATWANDTGTASWFSTNGTQGQHVHAAAGSAVVSKLSGSYRDVEVYVEGSASSVSGTGELSVFLRYTDISNWYRAVLNTTTGVLTVGSSNTVTGTLNGAVSPSVGTYAFRVQLIGQIIRAKVWPFPGSEPTAWSLVGAPNAEYPSAAGIALGDFDQSSAKTFTWDNLMVRDLDVPVTAITATAGPYTLDSNGNFWLRDPLRPCNDRLVSLCFDPAVPCVPGQGIYFAELAAENYAPNATKFLPTNARLPIAIARERRDADSALTLVTRTFADRDAVLDLAQPGEPLQFVAPPAYGLPDRYMSVDAVAVSRGVPDMTFEPRLVQLPYSTVGRPAGPSQGVCGSRFMDLCDTYATWDLAAASGLAYSTLVTGSPAALGFRTWAIVNATWASWAAVLAAEPTWAEVLVP